VRASPITIEELTTRRTASARGAEEARRGELADQTLEVVERRGRSPRQRNLLRLESFQPCQRFDPGEPIPHARRQPWSEPVAELDDAREGHLVAWVVDKAQMRQHVLDMPVFEEAETGAHSVGNVAPGELDLQLEGVRVIAVQHRRVLELDTLLA